MDVLNVDSFADGLDLAGRLAEQTGVHDPQHLLEAARLAESRACTDLELGVALGFRILAAAEMDERGDARQF